MSRALFAASLCFYPLLGPAFGRDQDDLALAVLLALVAEADRGRLPAALELVDEDW